ncbi:hypothetical protein [Yeosuana marina]|uniref:hypothetical protein n=1 Tax=Yeosuana marina TaxID=1565536 RepID=UPI0030C7C936
MKTNSLNNMNKTGFKVPKDYFENFEDMLLSELKLKETSKNTGFKVPEDYFKSLDSHITEAVKKDNKPKVIKLFTWKKASYATAIAASLILMFNVFYTQKNTLTLDNIETVSIENYLLNEDFQTTDMASLLTNEDLDDFDSIELNFQEESLEDYVFENSEIEDIISN